SFQYYVKVLCYPATSAENSREKSKLDPSQESSDLNDTLAETRSRCVTSSSSQQTNDQSGYPNCHDNQDVNSRNQRDQIVDTADCVNIEDSGKQPICPEKNWDS